MKLTLGVLIILSVSLAQGLVLECNFLYKSWPKIGTVYTCDAKSWKNLEDRVLRGVVGRHAYYLTNKDVRFLSVNQTLPFIPQNISKFLPTLQGIQWLDAELLEVSASDLKQFPNLKVFSVLGNEIKNVDGDLFTHTKSLEYIDFGYNLIEHVGKNLLKGLSKLKEINFVGNPCIDILAKSSSDIKALTKKLPAECPKIETSTRILYTIDDSVTDEAGTYQTDGTTAPQYDVTTEWNPYGPGWNPRSSSKAPEPDYTTQGNGYDPEDYTTQWNGYDPEDYTTQGNGYDPEWNLRRSSKAPEPDYTTQWNGYDPEDYTTQWNGYDPEWNLRSSSKAPEPDYTTQWNGYDPEDYTTQWNGYDPEWNLRSSSKAPEPDYTTQWNGYDPEDYTTQWNGYDPEWNLRSSSKAPEPDYTTQWNGYDPEDYTTQWNGYDPEWNLRSSSKAPEPDYTTQWNGYDPEDYTTQWNGYDPEWNIRSSSKAPEPDYTTQWNGYDPEDYTTQWNGYDPEWNLRSSSKAPEPDYTTQWNGYDPEDYTTQWNGYDPEWNLRSSSKAPEPDYSSHSQCPKFCRLQIDNTVSRLDSEILALKRAVTELLKATQRNTGTTRTTRIPKTTTDTLTVGQQTPSA